MVGNIIEPLNIASGGGSFDPDNYFDPRAVPSRKMV